MPRNEAPCSLRGDIIGVLKTTACACLDMHQESCASAGQPVRATEEAGAAGGPSMGWDVGPASRGFLDGCLLTVVGRQPTFLESSDATTASSAQRGSHCLQQCRPCLRSNLRAAGTVGGHCGGPRPQP